MDLVGHCQIIVMVSISKNLYSLLKFFYGKELKIQMSKRSVPTSFPLRNMSPASTMLISAARLLSLNMLETCKTKHKINQTVWKSRPGYVRIEMVTLGNSKWLVMYSRKMALQLHKMQQNGSWSGWTIAQPEVPHGWARLLFGCKSWLLSKFPLHSNSIGPMYIPVGCSFYRS